MATKLKNLKVTNVDFVDEGANPDADIKLTKRKGDADGEAPKKSGFMKKLFSFIGKAAGMEQDEIDSAMDEIAKEGAVTFGEMEERRKNDKIVDEIWDICYALQSSLASIINDGELDSNAAAEAMRTSLTDFTKTCGSCIDEWSNGKSASITKADKNVTDADVELMKSAVERLNAEIAKATSTEKPTDSSTGEGAKGDEEMKVDKSKMTPAERAIFEELEKKYSAEADEGVEPTETPAEGAGQIGKSKDAPEPAEDKDVYKGLDPAVKAELESLKKFREQAEEKELDEVAKKYEIIGKKREELVPMLKSLKAAGNGAYENMIALLDGAVATVEESGAFSEIGKSTHGETGSDAWAQAEAKATELMKSKNVSKAQALDEVLQSDPELREKCEKED